MSECDEKGHVPYQPSSLRDGETFALIHLRVPSRLEGVLPHDVKIQLCSRCKLVYWANPPA